MRGRRPRPLDERTKARELGLEPRLVVPKTTVLTIRRFPIDRSDLSSERSREIMFDLSHSKVIELNGDLGRAERRS